MNKTNALIYTMVAGATIGAVIGASMNMKKPKKVMIKKAAGKTLKSLGNYVEHMNF